MSTFFEAVASAEALLGERGRVSLRGLGRELGLDADDLDALVEELVEIQGVARREGAALAWAGTPSTGRTPEPRRSDGPGETASTAERRQLTVLFADLVDS